MIRTLCVCLLVMSQAGDAHATMIFRDAFDSETIDNPQLFARYGPIPVSTQGRALNLAYPSDQYTDPVTVECTLPVSALEGLAREIDISVLGGGSELSNSVFIGYSVGAGAGIFLPSLPDRPSLNSRSGYLVRFIRHGDGTNELKFYRIDDGWEKELANDWTLTFNPITTLRRVVIRHGPDGDHRVRAVFDTGAIIDKTWEFRDALYPPDNAHRGLWFAAKGHAAVRSTFSIHTDSWQVRHVPASRVESVATGERMPSIDTSTALAQAKTLMDATKYEEASESCRSVLAHEPSSADALELMIRIELAAGNPGIANMYIRRLLDVRRGVYGLNHTGVADLLVQQAGLYVSKDPEVAERLYLEAHRIRRKVLGPWHRDLAAVIIELAGVYKNQGRHAEAERYFARALEITQKVFGKDHPVAVTIMSRMADIYVSTGQAAQEEQFRLEIISILERSPSTDQMLLAKHIDALTALYERQRRTDKQTPLIEKSLVLKERILGGDHADVAKAVSNLGVVYLNAGRYAEAEGLFKRALRSREKNLGAGHPFVATELYNLGEACMRQRRYDESEAYLKRALAVTEKSLGPTHSYMATVLDKLAKLYRITNRLLDAASTMERANRIRNRSAKG